MNRDDVVENQSADSNIRRLNEEPRRGTRGWGAAMLSLLMASALSVSACGGDQKQAESPEGPAEEAGEAADEAADDTKDAAEEGADEAKDAAEEAGDKVEDATDN